MRIKRTLQPYIDEDKIIFGFGNPSLIRSLENSDKYLNMIKKLDENNELTSEDLEIVDEFTKLGLMTNNKYDDSKFSRNINFYEWLDRSTNTNPSIYQDKLNNSTVLIVGLGGIGSTVSEILARLGVGNFILVDFDLIEGSNLTRQSGFKKSDIGRYKVEVVANNIKQISDSEVVVSKTEIDSQEKLESFFQDFDFDIAICCSDTPRLKIDYWFDDLCHKYNIPFIVGSYASTVVNYLHIIPNKTISLKQFYDFCLITDEHLLPTEVPMSVIAPISYMAASMIAYKVFDSLTGLVGLIDNIQIDCTDWTVIPYDISKENISQ